ncbi:unnamed protein product, partial [Sphacelaria rigidula]
MPLGRRNPLRKGQRGSWGLLSPWVVYQKEGRGVKGDGWLMEESRLLSVVAHGRMLPVVCVAAGGNDVRGSERGRWAWLLRKSRLGLVVALVCTSHTRDDMRAGRRDLHRRG